ncbi:hypothetical protein B0H13DRAFT_1622602 [Mycena leptocephala]|nr:hypothetical protein B0H13DRAFT_1622602 [Mycena leptocephala]
MKVSASLIYLATLVSALGMANGLSQSEWSMTNVPSAGRTDITFPITILKADHISGYYFAQMYAFVNSGRAYIGIQPRPDASGRAVLHGTVSNFIAGSTPAHSNCHTGADGGDRVSCAVEWNGDYSHTYDFEVKRDADDPLVWVGMAIDTVTGLRTHIGSYKLPAGAGGIQHNELGFVEWYPWNGYEPPNHCAKLPYQKTLFGNPRTTHEGSVGTQSLFYETGDCIGKVDFQTAKVTGGVENSCGFPGQTGQFVVQEAAN